MKQRGPTPETRAKLKPDPVYHLIKVKYLEPRHETARDEIEIAARAIQAFGHTGFALQGYERGDRSHGLSITERQQRAWSHYNLWHDNLHHRGKDDVIRATMDAVLEPVGIRDIEHVLRIRHGRGAELIKEGLDYMLEMMDARGRQK